MRVAAIDCGTNSLRLLISEADASGGGGLAGGGGGTRGGGTGGSAPDATSRAVAIPIDVVRRTEIVRLGQGVDATGLIAPEAMERALLVIDSYAQECDRHAVEAVRFVATSASRDARNADQFAAGVRAAFAPYAWGRDVRPEVISGQEEAALSFAGATAAVRAAGHAAPYLVVDLGGGSTEFVRGGDAPQAAISVDVGSVRLTERLLGSDPPSTADVAAVAGATDAALDEVARTVDLAEIATLVGVAGTVTTLTALALDLPSYADWDVHLATFPPEAVLASCAELVAMTRAQRAALPVMVPGRADVIAAGAIVWSRVVARVAESSPGLAVVTCVHDILDGIVADRLRASAGGATARGDRS